MMPTQKEIDLPLLQTLERELKFLRDSPAWHDPTQSPQSAAVTAEERAERDEVAENIAA